MRWSLMFKRDDPYPIGGQTTGRQTGTVDKAEFCFPVAIRKNNLER